MLEFEPDYDEIRNGGYIVYDHEDIQELLNDDVEISNYWGINVEIFIETLRSLNNIALK